MPSPFFSDFMRFFSRKVFNSIDWLSHLLQDYVLLTRVVFSHRDSSVISCRYWRSAKDLPTLEFLETVALCLIFYIFIVESIRGFH